MFLTELCKLDTDLLEDLGQGMETLPLFVQFLYAFEKGKVMGSSFFVDLEALSAIFKLLPSVINAASVGLISQDYMGQQSKQGRVRIASALGTNLEGVII